MSISTASSSTPAAVVNWTNLQSDIIDIIVHRFDDLIDFINFGATCRTWRSVTLDHLRICCCRRQNSSQIPWLLLVRPSFQHPAFKRRKFKGECGLNSTVPPLHFYNFSNKKRYFINHPPHLMSDINIGRVELIGSSNGYLIYNSNVREPSEANNYFVEFQFYNDFNKPSSQNSILYFYNPVNGSHFSLPPAPVFDRNTVIINKNLHSDIVTVAAVCYDDEIEDPNCQKISIAVIRTGDPEWTIHNLSKVITDDFIEEVVFHQERLCAITYHLKMIVFESINDPSLFSKEARCILIESPARQVLCKVEENVFGEGTEDEYDAILMRKLVVSPDGKDLILYVIKRPLDITAPADKLFKLDWSRGQWDLIKCPLDDDLFFLMLSDMLFVVWKSQSHLIANCATSNDMYILYVVGDGCHNKGLNIPDNGEWDPYIWFIPNLS